MNKPVNKPLGKLPAMLLLAVAGWMPAANLSAADAKPALTIAFAGYDKLTADLKVIDKIDSHFGLAEKLEGFLQAATQGKKLAGLDKSRPWGVLVTVGESDDPVTQGYLPVSSLKELIAGLPAPGGAPTPNDKGVYEIPSPNGQTLFAKQKGEWAVLSNNEDSINAAKGDPSSHFSELAKKYLISVRGNVQNVPEKRRGDFLNAMRGLVQIALSAQPGNAEQQAMTQASVKQMFDGLDKMSKELDTLVIGLGIDAESKSLFLDVETRALDGTEMATKCAAMKDAKTNFAGFALPGAAVTMLASGTADDDQVTQGKQNIDKVKTILTKQLEDNEDLNDKQKELAKQLLSDAFDVARQTVEQKKSDGGLAVVLEDNPAMIAGWAIAAGEKLDTTFKKLAKEIISDKPELGSMIKLNAETYEDVKFHVATIPVPPAGGAKEVFGDAIQIVVGISDSRLYIGAGKDPIAALKKAIAASKESPDKAISPMEMVVSAGPIAKFIAKATPEGNPSDAQAKKVAGKIAEQLAKMPGKDRLTITVKPIENGALMRLSVDRGVLKTIMQTVKLYQQADGEVVVGELASRVASSRSEDPPSNDELWWVFVRLDRTLRGYGDFGPGRTTSRSGLAGAFCVLEFRL